MQGGSGNTLILNSLIVNSSLALHHIAFILRDGLYASLEAIHGFGCRFSQFTPFKLVNQEASLVTALYWHDRYLLNLTFYPDKVGIYIIGGDGVTDTVVKFYSDPDTSVDSICQILSAVIAGAN